MPRLRHSSRHATLALATALAVAACTSGSTTPGPSGPDSEPTPLVVGLGFIPSVQFAQYYLADRAGYYREAGLDVEFQNKIDPDLVTLVGQGAVDIGNADGTSVIPAVSQGIPVRYAATVYARFPAVVFTTADSGIRGAADLRGKRVGIPGRFGTSWIMLQGLLSSAGLTPDDLEIVLFPDFGQLAGLREGAVDAATGFANNEPVQLRLAGEEVVVLAVDEAVPLPGPGLIVGTSTLGAKRDALGAFVAATLMAMDEIAADPDAGLDAAIATVPELGQDRETQRAILEATIAVWRSPDGAPFGSIDRDAWAESLEFMASLPDDLVPNPVTVDDLVTDELLP